MKLYQELARLIGVRFRSELGGTGPKGTAERIETLVTDYTAYLPVGTRLDTGESHAEKLVFHASQKHIELGYRGERGELLHMVTPHTITITPSLQAPGYRLRITGRNLNNAKEKIRRAFMAALETEVKG